MNKDIIREPLLRFPGFDDEWKKEKLEDIVDFSKGKGYSLSDTTRFNSNNNPIVLYGDLFRDYPSSILKTKRFTDKLLKNAELSKGNEVLIPSSSTASRISIASPRALLKDGVIIGSDIVILRAKSCKNWDNVFLQHYLMGKSMNDFYKVIEGITVKHIYENSFSIFKISLPSIEEQSKIGSFFKTLDSFIEKQESYIDKLENEKKGLLQDIFSRDLRLLDDNGEKFEGEWKEVKLGEVSDNFQPKTISSKDLIVNGAYPVFGANGYIGYYNECNVYQETVLISCRGANSGSVNIVPKNTWVTGNSMVIQVIEDHVNESYLYNYLKSQCLKYMITGTAQPQIVKRDIDNHKIQLPSLEEQKAIGLFFDKIDKKIEKEKELLEKYKEMKKGLLQDMFI